MATAIGEKNRKMENYGDSGTILAFGEVSAASEENGGVGSELLAR